jgi:hypothetical protein
MRTSKATGFAVAVALEIGSLGSLARVNGATSTAGPAGGKVVDTKGNLCVPQNFRGL